MNKTRTRAYMPWYVGDYLADTQHLSVEEHGAYLLLMGYYWVKGGPIEKNEKFLRKILKISKHKASKILPVIYEFFDEKDGMLYHKRIEAEIFKSLSIREKRREAAKKRHQNREKKEEQMQAEDGCKSTANAEQMQGIHTRPYKDPLSLCARSTLPTGYRPPDNIVDLAYMRGIPPQLATDPAVVEKFCLVMRSNGKLSADWDAEFLLFLKREKLYLDAQGGKNARSGKGVKPSAREIAERQFETKGRVFDAD